MEQSDRIIRDESKEAQKKAVAKYNSANYEQILVRVAKGEKERMTTHAEAQGESLNAFINRAIIFTRWSKINPIQRRWRAVANKNVHSVIHADGIDIAVVTSIGNEDDYISLTDIAKYHNPKLPGYVIQNWMRNRSTIEFWGFGRS